MNGRFERDTGAALLAVLLLVAVMAVIASIMLDRLNLATRLAVNAQALGEARLAMAGGEQLGLAHVRAVVTADAARTVERSGVLGRDTMTVLGRARITARLDDAGNCFNVNSLVEPGPSEGYSNRLVALWQLRALMASLAIPPGESFPLSDAMADWIDSDDSPAPNGAEDGWYLRQSVAYRTAGRMIAELSELRAVKGMTPQLYQRLRPWLCALPEAQLSPINVNTLRPDQAPLLTMLAPAVMPVAGAQALLAARPPDGWENSEPVLRAFGAGLSAASGPKLATGPAAEGLTVPPGQLQVRSRWYALRQTVAAGSLRLDVESLIDAGSERPHVVMRRWGDEESR
ncbi:type II secretion system minor pseudopilin GspK [Novosphingobium sp.]|uniref:type II secretion system minor pseudopilin GspK n=1 Tax=Novosphingobium sp. TaxID=1874826 RepID=UPI0038BCF035